MPTPNARQAGKFVLIKTRTMNFSEPVLDLCTTLYALEVFSLLRPHLLDPTHSLSRKPFLFFISALFLP
jgi:hypothetical protein